MTLLEQFRAARRASVPIIAIETLDQPATIRAIGTATNGYPLILWDAIRGLSPLNEPAQEAISEITNGGEVDPAMLTNPAEMLSRVAQLPKKAVCFMSNAHRFITEPFVMQGVSNIREVFKANGATIVLLSPTMMLPEELKQDVMVLTEPLPNEDEIQAIVQSVCEDAGMKTVPEKLSSIVDCLIGLSAFAAEQTLATCIGKDDGGKVSINMKALWERKCKAIEQTPGLSIWRGGETFKDIGGCDNIKQYLTKILNGKNPPRAIVFIDEIEKAFAGSASDSSGVSQDQLGVILSFMQDKEVDGMIFIGPPGAAKSAMGKAAGNEGNRPTIGWDMNAMKNALVGKSGEQTRTALKVIEAVSQGRVLFIATCNRIAVLPPELRRRFTMGTFYFDLPSKEERPKIWDIFFKKYELKKQPLPDDEGWTGAEIKQCAKLASTLGISLKDAANYIVPVCKSAAEQIKALRQEASGKFINANKPGVYVAAVATSQGRRMIDTNAN